MQFKIDNIYGSKRQLLIKKTVIEIKNNSITTISGENGIGKTLLLNKMFDLCLQEGISAEYVDQSNKFILESVSIAENIAMSNDVKDIDRAKILLYECGMEHLVFHKPKELSGGEKRIICLLRGLYSDSKVLFIDEPTNDLDFMAVEKIKTLLHKNKSLKTIIVVSHDDRIKTISDDIINIKDKEIHYDEIFTTENIQEENNIETSKRDLFILLKKCCKRNILSYIITIIIAFLSVYTLFLYIDGLNSNEITINDDEVHIFSPMSLCSIDLTYNGAIPIYALSCFDESLSMTEKLDLYTTAFTDVSDMPVNYGLNIDEHENYNVFELEYYDLLNKEYYYTLDNYKELYGISSGENMDTGDYFVLGGIEEPVSDYVFSIEEFEESKKNLIEDSNLKSLECTFLVVKLNSDESFIDFVSSDSITKLMNGNFFIRSAETIKLIENLESIQNINNILRFIMYMGIILFIANIIVTLGCLISNKLVIRLFRNKGMSWIDIYNTVNKQFIAPLFKLFIIIVSIIVNIGILLFKNITFTLGSSVGIIFVVIFILSSSKATDFIVKKYIKEVCSWRYR